MSLPMCIVAPINHADPIGAWAGAATAPVGRAEGHAVGWHAARRAEGVRALRRGIASGVIANWMARTRLGGWRVRNGPRRACAGRVVKRHFGHSPTPGWSLPAKNRVPEVSLRRRRGLLVAARSSPPAALRGWNVRPCYELDLTARGVARMNSDYWPRDMRRSCNRPNALTLSCKRPPQVPAPESGTTAAATNKGRSELQPA